MHRMVLVAINEWGNVTQEEIEKSVTKELARYSEHLEYDEESDWEETTALYELISPDHPEAKSHIDQALLKTKPLEALRKAFVSMEEGRTESPDGRTYRSAKGGIAIFDAREYVRIDGAGNPTTQKFQIDWEATRLTHDNNINYNGDFVYKYAASLPKYALKSLRHANVNEICFMDAEGTIALGRSIRWLGKWDWWTIGGRWNDIYPDNITSGDITALDTTASWNPDIFKKAREYLETFVKDLTEINPNWEEVINDCRDRARSYGYGTQEESDESIGLRGVIHDWLRDIRKPPMPDETTHNELFGKDVDYTIGNTFPYDFSPLGIYSDIEKMMKYYRYLRIIPSAMVANGQWYDYNSYECGDGHWDVDAFLDRAERFLEDINGLGNFHKFVVVDIHQ